MPYCHACAILIKPVRFRLHVSNARGATLAIIVVLNFNRDIHAAGSRVSINHSAALAEVVADVAWVAACEHVAFDEGTLNSVEIDCAHADLQTVVQTRFLEY